MTRAIDPRCRPWCQRGNVEDDIAAIAIRVSKTTASRRLATKLAARLPMGLQAKMICRMLIYNNAATAT